MSLFICDECKCLENTSLGHYWGMNFIKFKDESKNSKALCSSCMPTEFSDGSKSSKGGMWHGEFEKRMPSKKEVLENIDQYVYTSDLLD